MKTDALRVLEAEEKRFLGVALNLGQLALGDDDRFRAFKKALMNEFHENHVPEIRRIVTELGTGIVAANEDHRRNIL